MPDEYDDVREYDRYFDRITAGMTEDERRHYVEHVRDTAGYQMWPTAKQVAAASRWMDPHDVLRSMMAVVTAYALDETPPE